LETTGLAPGRALHLVVVGEKTLLIGATDHQVSLLAELADVTTPLVEETSSFAATLAATTQQQSKAASFLDWQLALDNLRTSVQRIRQARQG
jgi:flagellar biogenesis protein FliO